MWKPDPTVTPALIKAAFTRAAANAHTTAPSTVSQYIFSPQAQADGDGHELLPADCLASWPEAAARAVRRSVMLATLRSEDRGSLAQRIFDETAIAIVEGRLRPGQTLNSVELARNASPPAGPRFARRWSNLSGRARSSSTRITGPGLPQPTLTQLRDIYELRASLFSLVSELIVDNCEPSRLAELWTWQAALEATPRAATSMTTSGIMPDSGW